MARWKPANRNRLRCHHHHHHHLGRVLGTPGRLLGSESASWQHLWLWVRTQKTPGNLQEAAGAAKNQLPSSALPCPPGSKSHWHLWEPSAGWAINTGLETGLSNSWRLLMCLAFSLFLLEEKRTKAVLTQRNKDSPGNWQEINELNDVWGGGLPFQLLWKCFPQLENLALEGFSPSRGI